ncbi:hypothetical protein GSI_10623 [Ganoderma sinense ZZ0214-1]|uniref:N-acetyltransferase domain-containing protein n=1 Tax=Ganoderma sinense ZZ0214-1 TaxID=1077348 RepID=A0A2G8S127_9APHY|nr:hypothetical protein GSI_10623 [Ganoderma sinense ZZ0214-1]
MSIFYDLVGRNDLEDAYAIESQGYPDDEAGSLEAFQYRQSQAPELFLGAYVPTDSGRKLVGYVCSTLSPDATLTHESMSKHVPGSSSVCIHSVCVAQEYRRQKLGLGLVKEYISRLSTNNDSSPAPYTRILLIAHEELRGFYEKAGFEWVAQSAVVHGARPWFEMRKALKPDLPQTSSSNNPTSQTPSISGSTKGDSIAAVPGCPTATQPPTDTDEKNVVSGTAPSEARSQVPSAQMQMPTQSIPPNIWEALQRESSRTRPVARLLASFPNAVQDVTSDDNAGDARQGSSNANTNKYDLLCPRAGCGSVILKAGVASSVEGASVQLEPPHGHAVPEALGALPVPPAAAQWWLVRGNAMAFENIGFSRPVQGAADGWRFSTDNWRRRFRNSSSNHCAFISGTATTIVPSGSGKSMKLLACAECDLGPLGWCQEGGSEFWLAVNRVGYRA